MGRMHVKRWPVRLTAINLPIDHVLRLFSCVVLTCLGRWRVESSMGATTDMYQTCDAHIHQKDGAPVESIPFALKNAPDPKPAFAASSSHT